MHILALKSLTPNSSYRLQKLPTKTVKFDKIPHLKSYVLYIQTKLQCTHLSLFGGECMVRLDSIPPEEGGTDSVVEELAG